MGAEHCHLLPFWMVLPLASSSWPHTWTYQLNTLKGASFWSFLSVDLSLLSSVLPWELQLLCSPPYLRCISSTQGVLWVSLPCTMPCKLSQSSELGQWQVSLGFFPVSHRSLSFVAWYSISWTPLFHILWKVWVVSRERESFWSLLLHLGWKQNSGLQAKHFEWTSAALLK